MFCTRCGAPLDDSSGACPQCGGAPNAQPAPSAVPAPPAPPSPEGEIKDYLTLNIVLLALSVLCCGSLPSIATGIIGVVFSSQTRDFVRMGQPDAAREKARWAKSMAIASGVLLGLTALALAALFALYGTLVFSMLASVPALLS